MPALPPSPPQKNVLDLYRVNRMWNSNHEGVKRVRVGYNNILCVERVDMMSCDLSFTDLPDCSSCPSMHCWSEGYCQTCKCSAMP